MTGPWHLTSTRMNDKVAISKSLDPNYITRAYLVPVSHLLIKITDYYIKFYYQDCNKLSWPKSTWRTQLTIHACHFTALFPGTLGSDGALTKERLTGSEQLLDFYEPDVYPATQPIMSKHYRKPSALVVFCFTDMVSVSAPHAQPTVSKHCWKHYRAYNIDAELFCQWNGKRDADFILYVVAPAANDISWCPKQIPNTGFAGSLARTSRSCSTVFMHISGFPGPLLTNNPSKSAQHKSTFTFSFL